MRSAIPQRIVPSVGPANRTPRRIEREFRDMLEAGARLLPVGEARRDPGGLLSGGYTPKHRFDLFDTTFFLTGVRQNPHLRFFVAYVVPPAKGGRARSIWPRIFYKDVSLVWRAASHLVRWGDEIWIGKGDTRSRIERGRVVTHSVESTTDLPVEIQHALETLNRGSGRVRTDEAALDLVLRGAPPHRLRPYRDFVEPRRRAAAHRANRINGGRSVARFTRRNDPTSLEFVPGFEPDLDRGIVEVHGLTSAMYGGPLQRFRILSRNRRIQYLFFAGPGHVWIAPPQATTTELSSYGVRTIDVVADENLFVPGYEYHCVDPAEDPASHYSQIPAGFAGHANHEDDSRADASRWLDALPIVRKFRRKVLCGARRCGALY